MVPESKLDKLSFARVTVQFLFGQSLKNFNHQRNCENYQILVGFCRLFFLCDAERHVTTTISIKSLTLEGTHSYYVSSGLEGLLAVTTWSFWDFSSVSSTILCIASDSEEPDLACTRTAIGNPSISRVPVPCFYSSTSSSVIKWLSGGYLKLSNISTC